MSITGAHDLSLRQLQYVVAVAETLGFHRAAERCHVSQPTLSAQVQQLESVLGVQLFERDRRRVLLTPAGEKVVDRARRVLVEVEDLLAVVRSVQDPFAGVFRVGVIPTVAPYFLPEATPRIVRAYPKLKLVFREEKTEDILKGLEAGDLDAGLLALDDSLHGWAQAPLGADPFVVALPRGHRLAKKKRVGLQDLEGEEVLLLDEGHCLRTQALDLCTKAKAREAAFRATSLSTLVQMVSQGEGVTLLPELAVDVENRRGQLELRPFTSPVPGRVLGLVWRPRSPYGDVFRAVASQLTTKRGGRAP